MSPDCAAGRRGRLPSSPAGAVPWDESQSTWVYITRDFSDNPVLSLIGHYEDVLTRTETDWRFRRRVAYLDFPYEALEL